MLTREANHAHAEYLAQKELPMDPELEAYLEREEHHRPFKELMNGANLVPISYSDKQADRRAGR